MVLYPITRIFYDIICRAGTSGKMQRIVEDKDETISALMAEGEKLQKQQLTSNNLIKKLRKKEKEADELNRDHKWVLLID